MRLISKIFAIILAVVSPEALTADTGGLILQVTDPQGQPLPNTQVRIQAPDVPTGANRKTDAQGKVRLAGLASSRYYQLQIQSQGFSELLVNPVRVIAGKTFELSYSLKSDRLETIEVSGRHLALLDTTSAITGMAITLDMTESLPTERSYQDYLQLVAGTKPSVDGNPASKSGVNYNYPGGRIGVSTDNIYYLDGVNVTDHQTGTFGASINSEIIQEQQVFTGGIPAEYAGGPGLVSRVLTKSGGNDWHGSLNYYWQSDALVSDHKYLSQNGFSTFDTALTLGGPLIDDQLWFFGSYQRKEREESLTDPVTDSWLRQINQHQDLGFLKLSWQPGEEDYWELSWFNDPQSIGGSNDPAVPNNRDRRRETGGDNYRLEYRRQGDNSLMTLRASRHESEDSVLAADNSTRNDVSYLASSAVQPTNADLNKGGLGSDRTNFRNKTEYLAKLEYFLDQGQYGSHVIKAGLLHTENDNKRDWRFTGEGAQYHSIGVSQSGATLNDYLSANWVGGVSLSTQDLTRVIDAIDNSEDVELYHARYDDDNNGQISHEELGNLIFDSSAGNPHGDINLYRHAMVQTAPISLESKGTTVFVQDSWTLDPWTLNLGIRAENWRHFSSSGDKIADFDWELAPRFSLVYDLGDDSKVWGFMGRYYDPLRTNTTNFAGNLTGPVRHEQLYLDDRWLTYRVRGGDRVPNAVFAPNTQTPYTDEWLLGYATQLSEALSLEVTYTDRVTRDIMEDYDLSVYSDGLRGTDFFLPLSYFGFDRQPNANYVIASMPDGRRDYQGVQLDLTRQRIDNWFFNASWTYNRATSNTYSDSEAHFQGDVVWMDPKAPNVAGPQPGNIRHLVKLYGSYRFDNGVEVGAVYHWNSGTVYSKTWSILGRHLPVRVEQPYAFGGVEDTHWIAEGAVGSRRSPSYGTLDFRVKYRHEFDHYQAEFFLDVFNLFNHQAVRREQDLAAGDGVFAFGEAMDWVEPRRLYLGARVSF
ncbi:Protein oar [Saliniradius amylolyticus]|uniref:Protein oar n=1 Tax=Saliniradius amylolyticus TaxID=2183582 RepID=A0A2S2E6W7_9ALTE|nr:TonB-dependent receptor [Saliniradius amylolyticus]AWL13388.1 Protein oar [Saliniradius amylolyticus]